jgi:Ion channel
VAGSGAKPIAMLSALLMFRRVAHALRYAVREQDFLMVFGAGMTLVFIGTLSYALGEGWNVVDALYFAVATLTTTSVSDPDLVLDKPWMKLFTVFYILIGIGILVEILRRLGIAFVAVRAQERAAKTAKKAGAAGKHGPDQPAVE